VDNDGEVGIGTLTPSAPLDVTGTSGTTMEVSAIGTGSAIQAYTGDPNGAALIALNDGYSNDGFAVYAENASPEGTAIYGFSNNGDAFSTGIGVHGVTTGDDGAAGVYGEAAGTLGESRGVWGHTDNVDGYAGYFTGGRNYFEGSLGVGVAVPARKLHVDGDILMSPAHELLFGSNFTKIYESSNDLYIRAQNDLYIQPDHDIRLDGITLFVDNSENRVGIGTASPDEELDVSGDIEVSGDYKYSSARTFYLNIPACMFQWQNLSDDDNFQITANYGRITSGSTPFNVTINAPVYLPDGAELTGEFKLYFYDEDIDDDLDATAYFLRRSLTSTSGVALAYLVTSSSGTSTDVQFDSDPVTVETIDNSTYAYTIDLIWSQDNAPASLRFYGCQIEYTMDHVSQ
jgi:hypothetical protein